MIDDLTNLDLDELRIELNGAAIDKANAASYEKRIKDEVIRRYNERLANELRNKEEPFGTVHLDAVKFTVPKKVDWDQAALADLYKEIGDTAHEYMDVSYKVREAAFKNWPSAIQDAFIPARTVKPGTIQIEFKEQ